MDCMARLAGTLLLPLGLVDENILRVCEIVPALTFGLVGEAHETLRCDPLSSLLFVILTTREFAMTGAAIAEAVVLVGVFWREFVALRAVGWLLARSCLEFD